MDSMEEKINSILSDPNTMQKLMTMAQSLGLNQAESAEQGTTSEPDLGMLQAVSGIAKQGSIDREQQALLKALGPYLSRQRINKLENAMRAAKMAKIAAVAFSQQGKFRSTGR